MPALITPFDPSGAVDETAFQSFVDWQVKQGSHGLVPVGTTGESPTLSHDEHKRVVELCVEAAAGRVPVLAGTGSNSTDEAIDLTRHAKEAGADGALVVTPYYNKPTQAGLYAHYKAINDAVDLPIIIYNIPGRSVVDMTVETMASLADLPNIVGVKDATADLDRVTLQRIACGEDFIQLSGEDGTALAQFAHGGVGCISVTANIAPSEVAAFQNALMAGDFKTALEWQDKLMPLHQAMFSETSPGPVKYAASLRGICDDRVRLPLVDISDENRAKVRCIMAGKNKNKGRADGLIAENRKARYNYTIEDTLEAGIQLHGTEVKSLRAGNANIAESYASVEDGELWLINSSIQEYSHGNIHNHNDRRRRKLLVHARELEKLAALVQRAGATIVPLKLYFNDKGRAKLLLGIAKGKKAHDKRETEKQRDWQRQKARLLRSDH
ncbi:dapA [Symbiodinium microadriaticum]|nr:dapA [Symbiodinium microadriaticum]